MAATAQFDDLCRNLNVSIDSPISDKLSRLRAIPGQTMLRTILRLKIPTFRATLDNIFISKDVFKYIYSGELARRFHRRNMKLLIGEVEHEEAVYNIGAPLRQPDLLPALQNYYCSSVAQVLADHYIKRDSDIESVYTEIVTDVQVRATTRAFSKALVDGGVPLKDVLRYRISLPIKAMDEILAPEQRERFARKVAHSFDLLHWWYFHAILDVEIGISNELDLTRLSTKLLNNGLRRLKIL
jgi:carboxylesterase type B